MSETTTTADYGDQIGEVRVGTLHDSVTVSDRTIHTGDVLVYEDELTREDIDRGITQRVFVGFVDAVCKMNRDGSPELMTDAGHGRVAVETAEVSGEDSRVDPQTGLAKFVDQFLNADGDTELKIEWGDGIGENGEDYRRFVR